MTVIEAGAIGLASTHTFTEFESQGEIDFAINCSLKVLKDANVARRAICT